MKLVKRNNDMWLPSVFDEFFGTDWLGGIESTTLKTPSVNILESEKGFSIELLVPGRKKEDFNIEVNNDILTISSETKSESDNQETAKFTRKEFSISAFKRSFTLPEIIDGDHVTASYDNGILRLMLPKKEEALPKPKRLIEIS